MGYTGSSIVDYLKSTGQATDYASRAKLASTKGINNYSGTAEQNTALLNALRGSGGSTSTTTKVATPTPTTTPTSSPTGANGVPGTVADNNMNYGGWYNNPSAGGKNQRYWGNGVWTDGEEPNLPKNSEDVTGYLNNYQNGVLKSNSTIPEVRTAIMGNKTAPVAPNFEATYNQIRADQGVADLEKSLADLKLTTEDIQAGLRTQKVDEQGKPVAMNVINGRITKEQQQAQDELDFVGRQISYITDQLTTKYAVIGQIMDLKKLDYTTATEAYQNEFNQNLSMYKLIDAKETEEKSSAKANLQIYMNAITSGSLDYNSLPADQKTQINKLEVQSGLPVGFTSSLKLDPKASVLFTSSNNGVTQVGIRGADGSIQVQSYGTPNKDSTTEEGKKQAMYTRLSSNANSYGHVDPDTYNSQKSVWTSAGLDPKAFDSQYQQFRDPNRTDNRYNLSE